MHETSRFNIATWNQCFETEFRIPGVNQEGRKVNDCKVSFKNDVKQFNANFKRTKNAYKV